MRFLATATVSALCPLTTSPFKADSRMLLRQLAVGFSRPLPQCLRSLASRTHRDRLRQLATLPVGGLPPFFLYCSCMLSFDILFTVGTLTFCDRRSKIPPPSWWSEAFWGSQNITSLPLRNTLVVITAFQLSTSKVADLNSHNLRQASKSSS